MGPGYPPECWTLSECWGSLKVTKSLSRYTGLWITEREFLEWAYRGGRGVASSWQYDLPDVVLDPDMSGRNDQETETDISQELNHITWPQKQRHTLSLLQWTTGKPHASCKSKVRMPDPRKSLTSNNNWRAKVSEQLKAGRKFNFNCLVLIHRPHFLCPYWKMTFGNTHGPLYLAAAGILQIHFVFSLWINTGGNYTLSDRSRIASTKEGVNKVTDSVLGL